MMVDKMVVLTVEMMAVLKVVMTVELMVGK